MFLPILIQRHRDARQGHIEDVGEVRIETGAVDDLPPASIPRGSPHDHLDPLLLAHRADAEDRRDVDEPDAANLHVVPLQLVTAPDDQVGAAALHDDEVVAVPDKESEVSTADRLAERRHIGPEYSGSTPPPSMDQLAKMKVRDMNGEKIGIVDDSYTDAQGPYLCGTWP